MDKEEKDIKDIFWNAVEKVGQRERQAYLQDACENDDEARAQVEELLRAHEQANGFFESPVGGSGVIHSNAPAEATSGTVIGRYKLLEQIGEGGMATVFMAEQTRPFHRRVALKIIKLGMDTKQVVNRFEAERQALALMDHPNIARVYDAGATHSGRPYFVMELVRGIAITEYCDKNRLSTKARLDLMISVCQAIQHAHQKGVIHRDIKPTNVMVSLHDGKPVVKVIDFGIAKAVNQRLTEKTLFTRFSQMVGTPQYMSPEQAEFCGLDVDTRTDIYSMGVLLYELLTGSTPFCSEALLNQGYAEMQRIIVEHEPEKPSTKLSAMGEAVTGVAQCRQASPDHLTRLLSGDLDLIVMKALEKDRTRRYGTAADLAEDIERHFRNEPVQARAPGFVYKMQKFARRNRMLVISTVLLVSVLLTTSTISTLMYLNAKQARQKEVAMRKHAEEAGARETQARLEAEKATGIAKEEWQRAERELSAGNIERGRLFGLNHNLLGEGLIWREFLRNPDSSHAFWAVWEYYQRNPCLATKSLDIERISDLVLSPDDKWLAVSSINGRILQLDLDSLEVLAHLDQDEPCESLSLSPDGQSLAASYASGAIRLWDMSTRTVLATLEGHRGMVWHVSHSPDGGRLASAGEDRTVRVWDLETFECLAVLHGRGASFNGVRFSPNGKVIGAVGPGQVLFWSSIHAAARQCDDAPGTRSMAYPVFSPDGRSFYVGSSDTNIRVYDVETGRRLSRLEPNNGTIRQLWLSNNGTVLNARGWWRVDRWHRETLEPMPSFTEPHMGYGGASSSDGRRIVTTSGHRVRVLEVAKDPGLMRLREHRGHARAIVSPDSTQVVTTDSAGTIRFWDVASGELRQTWPAKSPGFNTLALSPDGSLLAHGGMNGRIYLRDTETGVSRLLAKGASARTFQGIAFSPDGLLVGAAFEDRRFRIINTEDGKVVTVIPTEKVEALSIRFSPDGRTVATVPRKGVVEIWDIAGNLVSSFPCPEASQPWTVRFNEDGTKLTTGTWRGRVVVFDVASGHVDHVLKGHHGTVWQTEFVPGRDDLLVSGAADGLVKLWSLSLDRNVATFKAFPADAGTVDVTADGQRLVTSGSGSDVLVWDLSHFDRHIAGNLHYQIEQFDEELGDTISKSKLLDWAEAVRAH